MSCLDGCITCVCSHWLKFKAMHETLVNLHLAKINEMWKHSHVRLTSISPNHIQMQCLRSYRPRKQRLRRSNSFHLIRQFVLLASSWNQDILSHTPRKDLVSDEMVLGKCLGILIYCMNILTWCKLHQNYI